MLRNNEAIVAENRQGSRGTFLREAREIKCKVIGAGGERPTGDVAVFKTNHG
jgi:hypothetical protein